MAPSATEGTARIPPVRAQARTTVSRLWDAAVRRHNVPGTRVAAILWVSEKLVRAWGNPEMMQQIDVADVVAVHLAGGQVLALGFLRDVVRFLEKEAKRGMTRSEHVMAISASQGQVAAAARSGDTQRYRDALRTLERRVAQALADEEGDR